ncbi:MAG: helix-turn-helix transcriptional regulator [Geobacteraceae bacterium]|nr:helix-turn-helix transcriptional regulator [Geobacteraceae bacterium]
MQIATSPKVLGQILKSFRLQKGLNQHQAGELVGLTQAMVSRIERGESNARIDTLFRLLAALGMEMIVQSKGTGRDSSDGEKW